MIGIIEEYHKNIMSLIDSISVVNDKGKRLGTYEGIEHVCRIIKDSSENNGKVLFIGNGGSAAIASHMAIDFWKNGGIKALAFNDGCLLTCIGNDFGYKHIFEKPIELFANKGDILVAISSSGRSENIITGVQAAKGKGCGVITLSGFGVNNPLSSMGVCNFYVPSQEYGPVEVIHQYVCHWILDIIIGSK